MRTTPDEIKTAIDGVLEWDKRRNFILPYKVRDPLRAVVTTAHPATGAMTFDQAWESYVRRGYQYGHDALEQVRFGWRIAHEAGSPTGAADALTELVDACEAWKAAHPARINRTKDANAEERLKKAWQRAREVVGAIRR